ncbi:MAG TPA: hypothetical protein VFT86_08980 [Gaiellaceae bacterium]|nr:hypothetical protein [Gaiellaceae bacterium]
MRRAILTAFVLVATVSACGGESQPSASGNWTRHDVRDTSASIALPEEWKVIQDFDPQTISDFTKENEKFAPYVEPLIRNDVFKLFAIDPDIQEKFATNLNVIAAPVSVPLRQWVEQENASTRRLAVPGSLRTNYIQTPEGEAANVSWLLEVNSGGEKRQVRSLQYFFQQDGAGYVVTFSTLPSLATKYEPTFTKSAQSFSVD